MNPIKKLYGFFTSLLFPRSERVENIEKMTADEFQRQAPKASLVAELEEKDIYPIFTYRNELVKEAIWQLKYKGNRKVARMLGEIIYEEIIALLEDQELFLDFNTPIILAIPLSKKRQSKRGYNQIELMLHELKKLDRNTLFEFSSDILFKIKETTPQTLLKERRVRIANLRGCFEVKSGHIKNRNIILVDDVLTTGSTVLEAKRELLKAGARRVIVFTLAH